MNNEREFSDLLYFETWDNLIRHIYRDDKVSFCKCFPLLPKNTYDNSINAQHVVPTDRRVKHIGLSTTAYFYLVEFSTARNARI